MWSLRNGIGCLLVMNLTVLEVTPYLNAADGRRESQIVVF